MLLTRRGQAKLGDVGLARLQTRTCLSDLPSLAGTFACKLRDGQLGRGWPHGAACSGAAAAGKASLHTLPLMFPYPRAGVAPEVLMGGRNCTRAVDIYSFGSFWMVSTHMGDAWGRALPLCMACSLRC